MAYGSDQSPANARTIGIFILACGEPAAVTYRVDSACRKVLIHNSPDVSAILEMQVRFLPLPLFSLSENTR